MQMPNPSSFRLEFISPDSDSPIVRFVTTAEEVERIRGDGHEFKQSRQYDEQLVRELTIERDGARAALLRIRESQAHAEADNKADGPTMSALPPITGHKLHTSAGGRGYVAEYFATRLRRHDFGRYITERLAADFACALAAHLDSLAPPQWQVAAAGDDLLEVARATGLRQHMHGVNATDTRLILKRFVGAVHLLRERPPELAGIPEAIKEGGGLWRSCSGCHELNEGHDTGPYSKVFSCVLGSGCSECGGIGVVWDSTDYDEMARSVSNADAHSVSATAIGYVCAECEAAQRPGYPCGVCLSDEPYDGGRQIPVCLDAPTPSTSAADADLLASLAQAAKDFDECGETDVIDNELMAMAQRGWLECTHYVLTSQGRAAIAASAGR